MLVGKVENWKLEKAFKHSITIKFTQNFKIAENRCLTDLLMKIESNWSIKGINITEIQNDWGKIHSGLPFLEFSTIIIQIHSTFSFKTAMHVHNNL